MDGPLFEPRESRTGDYYENYPNVDFVNYRWLWLTYMIAGMAPLLYQTKGDQAALKWAYRFAGDYHDKVFATYSQTMHDIGFLYLPYSVHLYQLTGDTAHRDTALKAADELAKRFNVRGRFIEAWDDMNMEKRQGRMIADSAMNVSLLLWAWKETGHYFYHDIAVTHLETIIRTLVREDCSVAHAWFFDPEAGEPVKEASSCGYADGSHWARGTAWVVYGLAMAYTYTEREDFLEVAIKVGEKYLDSLEDGPVPIWDFRLPADKPAASNDPDEFEVYWDERLPENRSIVVDTSAAAIMACAFLLIDSVRKHDRMAKYVEDALQCMADKYLDTDLTKSGMLTHVDGKNIYGIYGDYYFMLALARKLYEIDTCWEWKEQKN